MVVGRGMHLWVQLTCLHHPDTNTGAKKGSAQNRRKVQWQTLYLR